MIKKILALTVGSALLIGSNALAITYTDENTVDVLFNGTGNNGGVTSHSSSFNLTPGYNPVTHTLTSATAVFTMYDVNGDEGFNITVEGDLFVTQGSFSASIDVGGSIVGALLGNLDEDGILNYTITRTGGNFWLWNAKLTAEGQERQPSTNGVPDGGATLTMLGMGLLGVFSIRRKLA